MKTVILQAKYVNTFKPNGIIHAYHYSNTPLNVNGLAQFDQSIYVLKGCWKVLFIFIHFNRMFCKQTVETMITLFVYVPYKEC